ncbi:hypothetical protein OJAV_G00020790 [Oryzias javanicus]|uniref:USP8 WW domain-containing protein n=1 Tax=Oryzias javanicus TaxID=123683 RepID=A0A437DGZ2_ORYJA|nr:hypothetical protein OJAV_G00020790 [Oryzias javanicus]
MQRPEERDVRCRLLLRFKSRQDACSVHGGEGTVLIHMSGRPQQESGNQARQDQHQEREPLTRARSEEMDRTVPGLPDGWMKFLDTVTGTYRYYHAPTNRVHLYPPEVTVPQTPPSTPPTVKQKAPQPAEPDTSHEREQEQSKLKRSYSSPDISQELREEAQKKAIAPPTPAVIPTINRDTK